MESKGTIKLFDGVYVGDQSSSRDQQLILLNHISAVINFTKLPNYYHHYDIHYTNIEWPNIDTAQMVTLISQVRQQGQSILLHGQHNLDIPVTAATIYLMDRFRWSLFKTLQFINSRIDGVAFTDGSFQILKKYQLKMLTQQPKLSYNWDRKCNDSEQQVLRNTFINSNLHRQKVIVLTSSKSKVKQKKRISWKLPQKDSYAPQHCKQKGSTCNLRDRVLLSVRKIMNKQQQPKGKVCNNELKQMNPSLKKYKSTYTLANLPLFQHQQSSRQLQQKQYQKSLPNTVIIKRTVTQENYTLPISKNQHPNSRALNRKNPSDSLKKIRMGKQIEEVSKKPTSKSFFVKMR